eukprot:1583200-Pleurochrysis_carterae.AAC.1
MSAWMRRPGYDGLYNVVLCVCLVTLASVQAAQPLKWPCASEDGASAVISGSFRKRLAPACRRLCMYAVAELGDITLGWWCILDACIAKHRDCASR